MLGLENVEDLSFLEDTSLARESSRRFPDGVSTRGSHAELVAEVTAAPLGTSEGHDDRLSKKRIGRSLLRAGKDVLQHVRNHMKKVM